VGQETIGLRRREPQDIPKEINRTHYMSTKKRENDFFLLQGVPHTVKQEKVFEAVRRSFHDGTITRREAEHAFEYFHLAFMHTDDVPY
jgi:hypothetical protein